MKKKNVATLLTLIVIAIVAIVLANWDAIKKKLKGTSNAAASDGTTTQQTTDNSQPTGGGSPNTGSDGTPLNWALTLYNGRYDSPEVERLQEWLNAGWNKGLVVDGDFGDNTEGALESITGQTSTNLTNFYNNYYLPLQNGNDNGGGGWYNWGLFF